ncbi:MAG: pre-peptidase C-terminal domain-containing protein [Planctomycetaceae bacterium]|nr:pre-peptidase C-terminal domain-containing protein [Planctomycetaceae bacterium]
MNSDRIRPHRIAGHWSWRQFVGAVLVLFSACEVGLAQLPATRLEGLFPAGAAPNSTVEITIAGADLDDVDRLLFSHPGFKAERKLAEETPFDEGRQPVDNVFLLTVASDVPVGNYEIRCQGKYGLSNPRTFVVSSLPEIVEAEPNGENNLPQWTEVDDGAGGKTRTNPATEITLASAVNGQSSSGADVDWFRFQGAQGERLIVDGFARRIDSQMDLVLSLYDATGRLLGESRAYQSGDPLLDVSLPANGEYFLKAHDALYRQGAGYFYRLHMGSFAHIDFVFPPAGLPGTNDEYTIYGRNLPGGQNSGFSIDGKPLQQVKAPIAIPGDVANRLEFSSRLDPHLGGVDGIEQRVVNGAYKSNPILITKATAPPVLEQPNNDTSKSPQQLMLPCEVAGQFYPQRDIDWYQFEAKQGEVWSIDVYSERLGLPTDPAFLLQRITLTEAGEQQVSGVVFLDDVQEQNFNNMSGRHEFDMRTTDPSYLFTVPADGAYRLMLKDGASSVKSDPRLVYRLAIRKPTHDFRVVAVPGDSTGSLMLRKGGRDVVRVFVDRQDGFDGEIRVSATGLPGGVTTEEVIIGPANRMGTLILTAAPDAPATVGTLNVMAKAVVEGQEIIRPARYGTALVPFQFNQPNANIPSVPGRLVNRIQVCVSDSEPAPQVLTIGDGKVIETSRGGVVKIPYQVARQEGTAGNLLGFPIDFPPQTNAQQVNIGGNEKGEFELRFAATTPPGTYTFYLAGFNQGMQYKRNPELAAKAKERQERIGKILTDAQQATQQAQQLTQQRQNELNQANTALSQANTQKQQADQAATNAANAQKQAEGALKQKQDAAATNPSDEALKAQVTQAVTARDDAAKKQKEAETLAAEATKKQQEATEVQTAATEAKTKADMEFQAAQQFQQRAQQEKQRADQFANQKQNEANPRGFNVHVPSNPVTLRIADFPINVDALPEAVSVKQGEKAEVVVKVSRLYEFTGAVNVQTQLPGGVGGVSIQNVTIPDNQPEAKYELSAAANATVGEHACTVRLQMNFNGQNLVLERPLKLQVIEVKPAE